MTAVIALVASAAVAVRVVGGPSFWAARGQGQGLWAGMLGASRMDSGRGLDCRVRGDRRSPHRGGQHLGPVRQ